MGFDLSGSAGSRGEGLRNYHFFPPLFFICANKYSLIVNDLGRVPAW